MILFLTGANDVELAAPHMKDISNLQTFSISSPKALLLTLANHSEVLSLGVNLIRSWRARNVQHKSIDLNTVPRRTLPEKERIELLQKQDVYLSGYKERLNNLVQTCRKANITPVLMTQPTLLSCGKDTSSGLKLSDIAYSNIDGCTAWKILEKYNDVAREISSEEEVALIDLAAKIPHDKKYFYDFYHFTNAGAEAVAEVVGQELLSFASFK
jgi:hypothetical protein